MSSSTNEDVVEVEPLKDHELNAFRDLIRDKSPSTIRSYVLSFHRLKKALQADINTSSEEYIISASEQLSPNLNTQAAYLNVACLIKKLYDSSSEELAKARATKKQAIIDFTRAETKKSSLPSLQEFDEHIEFLYDEERYKEYVLNYLIRYVHVRNQDLVFEIVYSESDANEEKNYMWVATNEKVVYIRRSYKTKSTYGEKVVEFTDAKLVSALSHIKGRIIPSQNQLDHYCKKLSFRELGEGMLLQIILNHTQAVGDWSLLNKISELRGTDCAALATAYHVQQDGDNSLTSTTRSGRPRKVR